MDADRRSMQHALKQSPEKGLTARIDRLFSTWNRQDSPGCALAMIKNGQFVYRAGYGMANLGQGLPITSDTVFYLASISKQFTAASIALLAQRGAISLDSPVVEYVPELSGVYSHVKIRHLIHHMSGIRDYLELMLFSGMDLDVAHHERDIIALLAQQESLNFQPGEGFLYSNSGYFLLSVIIERATGKSLHRFAEENIFRPLGMNHTCFYGDRTRVTSNLAVGYVSVKGGGFRPWMGSFDRPGDGGVLSTINDLRRWDQNFYHHRVGGKQLIAKLLTPGILDSGEKTNYAYGLYVSENGGLKIVSHQGALFGFRGEWIRLTRQKFSVICLSNLASINPSKLARQVAQLYFSDKLERTKGGSAPASDAANILHMLSERNPAQGSLEKVDLVDPSPRRTNRKRHAKALTLARTDHKAITVPALTASEWSEYTGAYYSKDLRVTYLIVVEKGRLEAVLKHGLAIPLSHVMTDLFRVDGSLMTIDIEFKRDRKRRILGFTLRTRRNSNLHFVKRRAVCHPPQRGNECLSDN